VNSFSSCTTVCTNIGLHNDVQHQCTSGGGKSEECLSSPRCSGLQRRVCNWHWHGLGRQRDSGRRRFLADFDCQCGQAWSLADRRPFRGQLQTNARTSIVKAIYSLKVMLFSAKLPGHSTANRASTSLDGAAPRYFQKATLKKIGDFIGVL
jgi:hypothetical protein